MIAIDIQWHPAAINASKKTHNPDGKKENLHSCLKNIKKRSLPILNPSQIFVLTFIIFTSDSEHRTRCLICRGRIRASGCFEGQGLPSDGTLIVLQWIGRHRQLMAMKCVNLVFDIRFVNEISQLVFFSVPDSLQVEFCRCHSREECGQGRDQSPHQNWGGYYQIQQTQVIFIHFVRRQQ